MGTSTSKILSRPTDYVTIVSVDDFLEANKGEKFIDIEQEYLRQIKEGDHDINMLKIRIARNSVRLRRT
jgi:hypothetical protein